MHTLIITYGLEVSKNGNKYEELIKIINDQESNNYDFNWSDESIKTHTSKI